MCAILFRNVQGFIDSIDKIEIVITFVFLIDYTLNVIVSTSRCVAHSTHARTNSP